MIFMSCLMNPKAVGELSEAIILAHLMRKGWAVSLPFGNNQRYDMLIDDGNSIRRAQCKTGRHTNGCIEFASSSKNGFTGKRTAYAAQVDVFLVYAPINEKIYLIPADQVTPTYTVLRVEPTHGGPTTTIRWAKDFEI